jgi:lysophospholipase L1-like esterase
MHPNGKGVAKIVENIMPKVEELLDKVETQRASVQSKS